MSTVSYGLIGIAWVFACVMIGIYISGVGISGHKQYRIGLKAILLSYLLGLSLLIVVLVSG